MKFSEIKTIGIAVIVLTVFVAGCDKIPSKSANVEKKKSVSDLVKEKMAVTPSSEVIATAAKIDSSDEVLPKSVIAKVGDWTLTVSDFNLRIKNIKQVMPDFDDKNIEAKKMLVDELIRQQLMVMEARNQKIDKSDDVLAAVKDFENNLLVQELVVGLTKDIKVSEADAKAYFDQNPDVFIKPVEKKITEIVVPTEKEAKEILVLLLQGGDAMMIAKDRSKGSSAKSGGDLGYLEQAPFEQMQKALEGIATKGGVSTVFQGPEGFYLVKVEDVRGGDKVTFEEVKGELIKGLSVQKQQQSVFAKLDEIAKRVKVSVNKTFFDAKTGE